MKIYEYARERNIKSKDVVNKLHELGFTYAKNHLSLVPEKLLDKLDQITFPNAKIKRESKIMTFISMECAPFVSSVVGDTVRNKLKYKNLDGDKNIVVLPKYNIDIQNLSHFMDINISVHHQIRTGKVFKTTYEEVDYYFVDSDFYFKRDKIYGFYDDSERFAFFAKAAIVIIKQLNLTIDIINVHDWPLGLFPILYKDTINNETKIEFTVYGSTYQGIYGLDVLTDVFELDRKYFDNHTVEYALSVNFLKAGILTADKIDINKIALDDMKNSYLKKFVYDNMYL